MANIAGSIVDELKFAILSFVELPMGDSMVIGSGAIFID